MILGECRDTPKIVVREVAENLVLGETAKVGGPPTWQNTGRRARFASSLVATGMTKCSTWSFGRQNSPKTRDRPGLDESREVEDLRFSLFRPAAETAPAKTCESGHRVGLSRRRKTRSTGKCRKRGSRLRELAGFAKIASSEAELVERLLLLRKTPPQPQEKHLSSAACGRKSFSARNADRGNGQSPHSPPEARKRTPPKKIESPQWQPAAALRCFSWPTRPIFGLCPGRTPPAPQDFRRLCGPVLVPEEVAHVAGLQVVEIPLVAVRIRNVHAVLCGKAQS